MALAIATPLDTLPGVRMVYSDLGVIILGEIVTRVSGQPFDRFLQDRVFRPARNARDDTSGPLPR